MSKFFEVTVEVVVTQHLKMHKRQKSQRNLLSRCQQSVTEVSSRKSCF